MGVPAFFRTGPSPGLPAKRTPEQKAIGDFARFPLCYWHFHYSGAVRVNIRSIAKTPLCTLQ